VRRALVVVGKAPRAGQVKTRLTPPLSPRRAARLYRAFLLDSVSLARAVPGCDVFVLYAPRPGAARALREVLPGDCRLLPQEGQGLGAALAFAFRHLLADGYCRVVLIGSDNPTLPPEQVRAAFSALGGADVVLGPTDDGGYYLIGMDRPHLGLFERITWSTERVADETRARADELGLRLREIATWYDVDTAAELERLAAEMLADPDHPAVHTRRQLAAWARRGVFRPSRRRSPGEGGEHSPRASAAAARQ
jgi:rSAM/selenodomain-associated transferase 1